MRIGIDLGNGYVKFKGKKFASRVRMGRLANFGEKNEEIHEVKYNKASYVIGEGQFFITDDRYFTNDYKLCLLTAIALSSDEIVIEADVCVGLPVMKYMSDIKQKVEEHLRDLGVQKITVNGIEKVINIKSVTVFVESALVVKDRSQGNEITIDIGAGTVNIIQWEDQVPKNFDTKNKSFYNLYNKIAKYLRDCERGDVSTEYIEKTLGQNEIIIDQKSVDIRDTHMIIEQHVRELASEITTAFDVSRALKVRLMGGGALPTYKYWKNIIPTIELVDNGQFINSEIYEKVLEMSGING
ncbi:ParM/StbA family protein [Clostridium botulinum]|uniref:ParM/StbA family protein n=1 Tax=Clostridium cagae TaxID=2080751 RepID=UPI0013CB5695|nr:ParM/StbA family protein [Clostridium botulinum]NFI64794.1 ParM/StbA family protein [Clostridium botulinum]NFJ45421.1 ParM/StbA family protein [Clostridium botulinum]NFJ49071.1 ParM/StbA family protein [Clostridium botulinum]NFK26955.1 ParM/StbA family protein [Clostridium botulinum]